MIRRPLWTACAALIGLVIALGCGGYSISIQPPPSTEVVMDVAPPSVDVDVVAPTPAPSKGAPKPKPAPAPAPAPAPVSRGTGQIQVTTAAAVQAFVDGVPVPFTAEQGYVTEVSSGSHELEIMNLVGTMVASQSVDVPKGQRVRFTYKPKTLTQNATVGVSPIPAPYVPEPVPEPAPVLPGSVEITGLSGYGSAVFVDGYGARYDSWQTSYIASGLTPGSHDLRVEIDGSVVYTGDAWVESGQNHRCLATFDGWSWALDCHFTRPAL